MTKHGRVVAKLLPATAANQLRIQQAILALKDLILGHPLKSDWKMLRDTGLNWE
jgi:hypothetical protein